MYHNQKGEIATFISIAVLIGISVMTFVTANITSNTAQKQTTEIKAEEDCPCGTETNYSDCTQYEEEDYVCGSYWTTECDPSDPEACNWVQRNSICTRKTSTCMSYGLKCTVCSAAQGSQDPDSFVSQQGDSTEPTTTDPADASTPGTSLEQILNSDNPLGSTGEDTSYSGWGWVYNNDDTSCSTGLCQTTCNNNQNWTGQNCGYNGTDECCTNKEEVVIDPDYAKNQEIAYYPCDGSCVTDNSKCVGDNYLNGDGCRADWGVGVCCMAAAPATQGMGDRQLSESQTVDCNEGRCLPDGECTGAYGNSEETCKVNGESRSCCVLKTGNGSQDPDSQAGNEQQYVESNDGNGAVGPGSEEKDQQFTDLNGSQDKEPGSEEKPMQQAVRSCESLNGVCEWDAYVDKTKYVAEPNGDCGLIMEYVKSCYKEISAVATEDSNENSGQGVVMINGTKSTSYDFGVGTLNVISVPSAYTDDNPAEITISVDENSGKVVVNWPEDVQYSTNFNDPYE